jgi:P27 family predicted phage terminase small subunit
MRGRKPKPIEQRIAEGNPRKHAVPQPVLVSGRPQLHELDEPPEHLPPEAQEFWRTSVTRLIEVGIIDRVDVPVLEQLAVQYARIRQAQRVLAQDGHYSRGAAGQLKRHPAMDIESNATAMFLKIAEHYALTPIARTRLGLAELHRRSLASELNDGLGAPDLVPVTLTSEDPDEIDHAVSDLARQTPMPAHYDLDKPPHK